MKDRTVYIRQYKPSESVEGFNVKECEWDGTRTAAIEKISTVFKRHGIGGKIPNVAAELAIDALLGIED